MPDLIRVRGTDETGCLKKDPQEHWRLRTEFPHDGRYEGGDDERECKLEATNEGVVGGGGGGEGISGKIVREVDGVGLGLLALTWR
jgi:hypothetical protein